MQIVATTDFHWGLYDKAEIIYRGTTFAPEGSGVMSAKDQAMMLLKHGTCCLPSDWPKVQEKTEEGYQWAKAETARNRAAYEAHKAARAS